MAGCELLVAAWAVGDRDPGAGQAPHFCWRKMHAMGYPDTGGQPAILFDVIQRPATIDFGAIARFVCRLSKTGVQADVKRLRERRGPLHQ